MKKFFSGLLIIIFTWTIFSFTVLTTLIILLQPARIKEWVNKSGLYTTLPSAVINQANSEKTETNEGDISFTDPTVQAAVKKALSAEFLQGSAENIVDGTFVWLDGASAKPTFSVDVLAAKKVFANEVAQGAIARYQSLPDCSAGQLPKSTDPLLIDCRPAQGVDIIASADNLRSSILDNKDFLPDATINAETLQGESKQGDNVFGPQSQIPKVYQRAQLSPFILGFFLLLVGVGAVMLSSVRRRTVSKLAVIMITTGVLSLITLAVANIGLDKIEGQYTNSSSPVFKDILLKGLDAMRADALTTVGVISAALIVIGVIILVSTKLIKRKSRLPKSETPTTSTEPEKPIRPVQTASSTEPAQRQITTAPEVKRKPSKKLIQ